MRLSVANSERSTPLLAGRSLLDAALAAGWPVPHGCRGGNCAACRARLIRGEVRYPRGTPLGLTPEEALDGHILLCQAQAEGDVCVELTEQRVAAAVERRRLPCRVERVRELAADVVAVTLRLPAAEDFPYEPGQYVEVLLPGGLRRSFSIANLPEESRHLELHVRRRSGGAFAQRCAVASAVGTLLAVEGPYGAFTFRPSSRTVIALAAGTGLAPLHALLRRALARRSAPAIRLYWGVRGREDLYAHAELDALAGRHPELGYVPVLSAAPPDWRGRRGWVQHAALEDGVDVGAVDVYASGPPEMVAAVRREFLDRGLPRERLIVEAFEPAAG